MKKFFALIFTFCIMTSAFAELTEKQRVSLTMLNYIMYLTEDINTHSDNRLYLEEIDKRIRNNTYPDSIDQKYTLPILECYLERIFDYQKIVVQRERVRILFENQKAQAIKKSMPNPLLILNLSTGSSNSTMNKVSFREAIKNTKESFRNLAKVGLVALDSGMKYSLAKNEAQIDYIKQNWELDDKELETLKSLSRDSFSYMTNITNEYKIDEGTSKSNTLSPSMITDFISYQNNSNLDKKIASLEGRWEDYKNFGPYYLLLAKCYYEKGIEKEDTAYFEKVLNTIAQYEKVYGQIFRKDYEYGKVLPLAVVAARELYGEDSVKYKRYILEKVSKIADNSDTSDWELRYFTAVLYIDLARITGEKDAYLKKAYDVILNEVTYFSDESASMVDSYLAPISQEKLETLQNRLNKTKAKYEEAKITKSKEQELEYKKEIKNLEKSIKSEKEILEQQSEERQTELFPISEPLLLNCQLLFNIFDEISFTDTERRIEKDKIYGILKDSFIFPQLQEAYAGINKKTSESIDNLLYDLIVKTNPEIDKHSRKFQKVFISEYENLYNSILTKDLVSDDEYSVSSLADKVRFTDEYNAKWNSSELVIPAVFLCKSASIKVTVLETNSERKEYFFTLDENPDKKEKKENTFFVKKINKPKILKRDKTLKDWTCEVVFVQSELNQMKFPEDGNCLIIVDCLIGEPVASFIFTNSFSKKKNNFEQVHMTTFIDSVQEASFDFPKTTGEFSKTLKLSDSLETVLSEYIISDNPGIKNLSEDFRKAFINEYKFDYYEKINYITGATTDKELADILKNAELSKKVKASIDDSIITLHSGLVHDFNESCEIDIDIFEDNKQIFSAKNISYVVKKTNDKESVSTLEITDKEYKKIKFDNKKRYRIQMVVRNGETSYPVIFNSVDSKFLIFKDQKFITFSEYLRLLLESDEKNK